MKPLFDFNGNGKMDLLEFLTGAGVFDPNSPINKGSKETNDSSSVWGQSPFSKNDED